MTETPDILDQFPELRFPPERALVTPNEIAKKMRCSDEKVFGFCDEGSLAFMPLTGKGTKLERTHLRIPVSSYYALLRRRFRCGWSPKDEPDPKQRELPL